MASGANLAIVLKARDEASSVFSHVSQGAGGLGTALGNVASTAAGFVVGTVLTQLPGFLMDAAKAAAADEQATARLSQTVRSLGGDYQGTMVAVNNAIAAGQRLAFTDDEVRDSFQFLAQATGDSDEALKRQSAAMDLARGANIPLAMATKMLGKMSDENVETFRKLGITIGDNATEADALAAIQAKFGGQADAYANSTKGQFEQATIALAETKEALGAALLPVMARLGQVLVSILPQLQDFAGVIGTAIAAAVETAIAVLDPLADAFGGLFEILTGDGEEALDAVYAGLDRFISDDAIGNIINIVHFLGETFRAVLEGDIPAAVDGFLGILEDAASLIVTLVEDWARAIAGWVDGADSELLANLGAMLVNVGSWIVDGAVKLIEKLAAWAAAFVDWIGPKIPDLLRELGSFLISLVVWVADSLPGILAKLAEWGLAFVAWIAPRIIPMLAALGGLLLELAGWIVGTALPAILSKLAEWGLAFISWVVPQIPGLLVALGMLGSAILGWVAGVLGAIGTAAAGIGQALVDGIAGAITSGAARIRSAASSALQSALDAAKAAMGISSPSEKWWQEVGVPIGHGVIGGMLATAPALMIATREMLRPAVEYASQIARNMAQEALAMAEAARQAAMAMSKAKNLKDIGDILKDLSALFDKGMGKLPPPIFGPPPPITGPNKPPIFGPPPPVTGPNTPPIFGPRHDILELRVKIGDEESARVYVTGKELAARLGQD